jgi:hypothetical protein
MVGLGDYHYSGAAMNHGASAEEETPEPEVAYARASSGGSKPPVARTG